MSRAINHSIDRIFHRGYIKQMAWEVEYTDEFEAWWVSLTEEEQIELDAKIRLLQQQGPVLPRPHSDVIVTSKHANMKELRGRIVSPRHRAELRVLYAFESPPSGYFAHRRRQDRQSQMVRSICTYRRPVVR
jgi:hypothetical protein